MRKSSRNALIVIAILLVLGIIIGNPEENIEKKEDVTKTESNKDEIKQSEIQENDNNQKEQQIAEKEEAPKQEQPKELTESEYKELCREMYYDEVFFGDDDLESKYVKLHLMLSEKYYFTNDDMYMNTWKEIDNKYNLNRDFFKCCVLRENENSYMGKSINMWFSNKNGIDPNSYDIGNKVTVYAEVISWNNNTWNGYNSVTIIPKYIE